MPPNMNLTNNYLDHDEAPVPVEYKLLTAPEVPNMCILTAIELSTAWLVVILTPGYPERHYRALDLPEG